MCLIYQFLAFLFGSNECGLDRTALWTGVAAFWTGMAAIVATVAIYIALCELKHTGNTTRADFAKRFIDSYFITESRDMFTLLMNSSLQFDELIIKDKDGNKIDHLPYLKIDKYIAGQLKGLIEIKSEKTGYSAFEIDDLLLGTFEDMGWYEHRGLIDWETIEEMFGYYIRTTYENPEIQKYLEHEDCKGKYDNFRRLAVRLKSNK